jgi:hypothetical protein
MSVNADNLSSAVRYALETTRAVAVCPFHCDVIIRIGDEPPKNMLLCAQQGSSKAMARRGTENPFAKNLDANSAKPLTVTVLSAPVWATRSYEASECDRASGCRRSHEPATPCVWVHPDDEQSLSLKRLSAP